MTEDHDCSTGSYGGTSESEYLLFTEIHDTGKTKVWLVLSKRSGDQLATIRWYGPWRCYTMWPSEGTIWNKGCLEDINAFIAAAMADRKAKPLTDLPPTTTDIAVWQGTACTCPSEDDDEQGHLLSCAKWQAVFEHNRAAKT